MLIESVELDKQYLKTIYQNGFKPEESLVVTSVDADSIFIRKKKYSSKIFYEFNLEFFNLANQ